MDDTSNDGGEYAGLARKCSIADLPPDCLQMIISYLHVRHWPQIELVNRRFRDGVRASWWRLNEAKLEQFCEKKVLARKATGTEILQCLLHTIYNRSPNIRSIGGFSAFLPPSGIDRLLELVQLDPVQLAEFRNLKSVTFLDCSFSVESLATFLAESESRSGLEELRVMYSMPPWNEETATDDERQAVREALMSKEGRPPLRLRKLLYERARRCPGELLSSLDASNLEFLSLIEHRFPINDVIELLRRCVHLKELHIDIRPFLCSSLATGAILDSLKSLPCRNLRRFGLEGWELVRGSGIAETLKRLALQCPALRILDLPCSWWYGLRRTPNCGVLDVVGDRFDSLEELKLDTEGMPVAIVLRLLPRLERLKRLTINLDHRRNASGDIVVAVASYMKDLTKLNLDLYYIDPDKLSALVQLKNLKELSIRCPFVDKQVAVLCQSLRKVLVSLHLSWASKATDQQLIAAIGSRQTRIRCLSLSSFEMITGASLRAIADSCPLLEELDIRNVQATASDIKNVIGKCKKLTSLKLLSSFPGAKELIMDSPANIVLMPELRGDVPSGELFFLRQ